MTASPPTLVALFHDVEQDLDNAAGRDACRRALRDLLAVERRAGVRSTCHVAGALLDGQPELARWIRSAGCEVAFHSYHHAPDWNPSHHAPEVARCRAADPSIAGYRSPRNQWSDATADALAAHGFAWNAEGDPHDEPYFLREGLVRLPLAGDDWALHTGAVDAETWVRRFQVALRRRTFVGWGCHDFVVASRPEVLLRAWTEICRLAAAPGLLPVTMGEAADLFRRSARARERGAPGPPDAPFHHLPPGTPRWLRFAMRAARRAGGRPRLPSR